MSDTIDTPGLSDKAREFSDTRVFFQPPEGLDIPWVMYAPCDFQLLRLFYLCQAGSCDLFIYIDDELVEFDDALTNGHIPINGPTVLETLPDSTDPNNYIVREGQRLSVVFDNLSTHTPAVELQLDCRLLQKRDTDT